MKQYEAEEKWGRLAELALDARDCPPKQASKSEWQALAVDLGVQLVKDIGMCDAVGITMPGNQVTFGEVQVLSKIPVTDYRTGKVVTSNWTLSLLFDSPDISETRWNNLAGGGTNANAVARIANSPVLWSARYLDLAYRYDYEVSYLGAMTYRRLWENITIPDYAIDWRNMYDSHYFE